MRSSGGLIALDEAAALPAAILLSGPAGGAIAAEAVATGLGRSRVISFDMGGTSTDVCRIDNGVIDVSYERSIDGYPCRLPSVGIHTVGAGGGSIAWIDSGGALRVGPQSAGAHPGPASYGLGGIDPTVTDANVVLGRIDAHAIFGDSVAIDVGRAKRAVESVASPLELSLTDAALGIVRIAEEVMAGAVRTVSVEQGADPAGAWLIAFGGAGGLHAPAIARSLGMAGVIVPRHSGVFSALGLLLSPPRADAVAAVNIMNDRLDDARIVGEGLDRQVRRQLVRAGHEPGRVGFALDVRYLGQAHEITVAWSPNEEVAVVRQRFEKLHRQRNGFIRGEDPLEIVAVRCTAVGDPPMSRDVLGAWTPGEKRESTSRMIVTAHHGERSADVIDRLGLAAGDAVYGPAIIEEREATTFLDVGETATVTKDGSLEVTW
jgi:N-methylhydantoinase A